MRKPSLRKTAVLLLSLPEEQAAALLAAFPADVAAAISAEMACVADFQGEEQESIVREFLADVANGPTADRVIRKTLPFASVKSPRESRPSEGRHPATEPAFQFLENLEIDEILLLVGDEHPQTIAVVASQLPPHRAAEILALLPAGKQAAVTTRLAAMQEPPAADILADVAASLGRRRLAPAKNALSRGMGAVVKLFGAMPPPAERKLLEGIAQADPPLFHDIRVAMFGPDVAAAG